MEFAIRSSPVLPERRRRVLTRARLAMILVAYISFNMGVYYGTSFKDDKRFWRTLLNIATATFDR